MKSICVLLSTLCLVYSAPTDNVLSCISDATGQALDTPAGDFSEIRDLVSQECNPSGVALECHIGMWNVQSRIAVETIAYIQQIQDELAKCDHEDSICMVGAIYGKDELLNNIDSIDLPLKVSNIQNKCEGNAEAATCAASAFGDLKGATEGSISVYEQLEKNIKEKCAAH